MLDFDAAKSEILGVIAESIRVAPETLDPTKSWEDLGLDSLDMINLLATIEGIIRQELPDDIVQQVKCPNDMFEMIREQTTVV